MSWACAVKQCGWSSKNNHFGLTCADRDALSSLALKCMCIPALMTYMFMALENLGHAIRN